MFENSKASCAAPRSKPIAHAELSTDDIAVRVLARGPSLGRVPVAAGGSITRNVRIRGVANLCLDHAPKRMQQLSPAVRVEVFEARRSEKLEHPVDRFHGGQAHRIRLVLDEELGGSPIVEADPR